MDLTDGDTRARVRARLGELYAGRPVVFGPGVLAGYAPYVELVAALGSPALCLVTARGAGPVPDPATCRVVELEQPRTDLITEELRAHDRLVRPLPPAAAAAIEEFDPDRRAVWWTSPFVTSDEPLLGRPVTQGRPASILALEDKMVADTVWAAAGVEAAPHRIVPVEPEALARASAELATPLGVVWAGDARDGFNGGGEFVRWVVDAADREAALAFFATRCDRVRVMPFLDGVPCSIHGMVLPGGTAAFRPVEIVMLRSTTERRFVYGGLSTYWDPPEADRRAMREAVRRVGDHLAAAYGYRGAFGIDGVLTADGFRPTELNSRMSAGATAVAEVDKAFFALLQGNLLAGVDTGLTPADLEGLVSLMDAERTGKVLTLAPGVEVETDDHPVAWDGLALTRADRDTGTRLEVASTPTGMFARLRPCDLLTVGARSAPLNAALIAYLDATYGTGLGPVEAAPDRRL